MVYTMPYSMSVFPMIIKIFLIIVSGMGKQLSLYGISESSFRDRSFPRQETYAVQAGRGTKPGRPDGAQATAAGGVNYVHFHVFAKCLHSAAYFLPAGRVKYRCRKGGGSDVGPVPGCTADKNKARVKR